MIETDRLLLRNWTDDDLDPFAEMNADPAVMEHFPRWPSRAESDGLAARERTRVAERGWGLFAVEADTGFIGFVGLAVPGFDAHFMPAVEIGWRLARPAWGKGYATEAALTCLARAPGWGIERVVSFTTTANTRSRAVMERIGLAHDPADDFDHPLIAAGHPLRRHVMYRSDELG